MQRDMDLIREILLLMERHEHGHSPAIDIPGHTDEEIAFHVWLLNDAKLIKAVDATTIADRSPKALPIHLTWQGYEFLEAARDKNHWEAGKKWVLSKAGGLSFELIKTYLLFEAKRHLGIE